LQLRRWHRRARVGNHRLRPRMGWVGLAVWAVVFAAMLRRGYQLPRQTPTRLDPVRVDKPVAGRPDAA
jgi:hypothetical protein